MNFEELQKTWQKQSQETKVTINSDLLLREVRRNQKHFKATIFWRDVREVGVGIFCIWFFLHRAWVNQDWTDCLVAAGCLFVTAFILTDRFLQRAKGPAKSDSLKECVENSLRQVKHQIWLLENVFWWYLLPIAVPVTISASSHRRHSLIAFWIGYGVFLILLNLGIYWLNQWAVRKGLQPRERDLEALLADIEQQPRMDASEGEF